jgi:preprotein translocase subunit SecB
MKMTENFKIVAEFVKDMSSETKDINTYLVAKQNISKYELDINISSKVIKNTTIEISTSLKFEDKSLNEKKSYFEIVYVSIVQITKDTKEDKLLNKKELEKIILIDVQNIIYPRLEKAFLNLLHNSGFPEINLNDKIDFKKLYEKNLIKKNFS